MSKDNSSAVQAIMAAEASLKLARQLLGGGGSGRSFAPEGRSQERDFSNLPYIDGTFDGFNMIDKSGKKYAVSTNYATKSMLVYGDKLRAYDDNGRYWFKQIDKVRREKTSGVLTKKAGVWHVVTADGSYKVSSNAVDFLGFKMDDEVGVLLPYGNKRVPFATLDFDVKPRKPLVKSEPDSGEKAASQKVAGEAGSERKKEEKPKAVSKPLAKKAEAKKTVAKKEPKKEPLEEKIVLEADDLR